MNFKKRLFIELFTSFLFSFIGAIIGSFFITLFALVCFRFGIYLEFMSSQNGPLIVRLFGCPLGSILGIYVANNFLLKYRKFSILSASVALLSGLLSAYVGLFNIGLISIPGYFPLIALASIVAVISVAIYYSVLFLRQFMESQNWLKSL